MKMNLNKITYGCWMLFFVTAATTTTTPAAAFDYSITSAGVIGLTDVATSISGLETIFTGEETLVSVSGLEWVPNDDVNATETENLLKYTTLVDGVAKAEGSMSLDDVGRDLPIELDCGTIVIPENGRYTIEVILTVDNSEASTSDEYQVYKAGVAIIPILVILILALTTHMVELSLFTGVFVGACIVAGNLKSGFMSTLDTYILMALADEWHVYVILFGFFLSGLVAMMEKSGGMLGFTKAVSKYAKSARTGQLVCFMAGLLIFFDDYANCLVAGKSLRPLLDTLFVSREKLSFIVDATAAPIASISPVSSWVGFEIGLIQTEIDRIIDMQGTTDIGIETNGFAVFLESIKYRYYPIFMLVLMFILIVSQRDFGSMLIAERKTQVYKRTDGGSGASDRRSETENDADITRVNHGATIVGGVNDPRKDTPPRAWNMLVPLSVLIFFIFYVLVKSGENDEGDQSIRDKIVNGDSYAALLYGTMAAAWITIVFYLLQIVRDGEIILIPGFRAIMEALSGRSSAGSNNNNDPTKRARFLMSVRDSVDSFIIGFGRIFPAFVVLTLAWASGSIMVAVGADRLFASWILAGGIPPESLPTLSFVISLFIALATGTSWGTMTILFPLLLVPTYTASNGDEAIFYSTVAGILSGSVAGDHASVISDTTVLSSLACDCDHLSHVGTQFPYVVLVSIVAIVLGTIPIGYASDSWPNIVSIILGVACILGFVYLVCKPILSPTGKYDIITELYLKIAKGDNTESLNILRDNTVKAYNGEATALVVNEERFTSEGSSTQLAAEEGDYTEINHDITSSQKEKEETSQDDSNSVDNSMEEGILSTVSEKGETNKTGRYNY